VCNPPFFCRPRGIVVSFYLLWVIVRACKACGSIVIYKASQWRWKNKKTTKAKGTWWGTPDSVTKNLLEGCLWSPCRCWSISTAWLSILKRSKMIHSGWRVLCKWVSILAYVKALNSGHMSNGNHYVDVRHNFRCLSIWLMVYVDVKYFFRCLWYLN